MKLAKLSLSGPDGSEHVVDPEFAEWYEPFPHNLREGVETSLRDLRAELLKMAEAVRGHQSAIPPAADEILSRVAKLRETIRREGAENGCRRVLRDLETIAWCLRPAI